MVEEVPVHLGLDAFFAVEETGIPSSGDGSVDSASSSR